jgi:hypothetical protein
MLGKSFHLTRYILSIRGVVRWTHGKRTIVPMGNCVGLEFLFNTCTASPFEIGIGDVEALAFGPTWAAPPQVDYDSSGERLHVDARTGCLRR